MSIYSMPWEKYVAITASNDTVYNPPLRGIYVGTLGNLTIWGIDDVPVNLVGFQGVWPGYVKKILATGLTAAAIVGGR